MEFDENDEPKCATQNDESPSSPKALIRSASSTLVQPTVSSLVQPTVSSLVQPEADEAYRYNLTACTFVSTV